MYRQINHSSFSRFFLSVLLLTFLAFSLAPTSLFSSFFVAFAQDYPTPPPTPTYVPIPSTVPTPTYVPTPTPNDYSEVFVTNTLNNSNSEYISPDGTTLPSIEEINTLIASQSATLDISITNNNLSNVNNIVSTFNSTGGNTAIKNIDVFNPLDIDTGEALIEDNHSNILNTNIIGRYIIPALVNFFGLTEEQYDYSDIAPCVAEKLLLSGDIHFTEADGNTTHIEDIYNRDSSLAITNNNDASVINDIDATATTGSNVSKDNIALTAIYTGDAIIDVNIFNLINTNLVGECGFFGVFNFFDPTTQSLVLPDAAGFYDRVPTSPVTTSLSILNSNESNLDTTLDSTAATGNNTLSDSFNFSRTPAIITGDAETTQHALDLTNLNIALDNFLYVRIQHYGNWTGRLLGWDGEVLQGPDFIILYKDPTAAAEIETTTDLNLIPDEDRIPVIIQNNNKARVLTDLDLLADTGSNSILNQYNSEIETGDAEINAHVLNLVNTNITGRNWFFGIINMFSDFSGDIIFPKADASVSLVADKTHVKTNDTFTYSLTYSNAGYLPAENMSLVLVVPPDVRILSASRKAIKTGNNLIWSLGDVQKKEFGTITLQAQAMGSSANSPTLATGVVYTTSPELFEDNNSSTVSTYYSVPPKPTAQAASSNSSSSTQPAGTVAAQRTTYLPFTPPYKAPFQKIIDSAKGMSIINAHRNVCREPEIIPLYKNLFFWFWVVVAYVLGILTTKFWKEIKEVLKKAYIFTRHYLDRLLTIIVTKSRIVAQRSFVLRK